MTGLMDSLAHLEMKTNTPHGQHLYVVKGRYIASNFNIDQIKKIYQSNAVLLLTSHPQIIISAIKEIRNTIDKKKPSTEESQDIRNIIDWAKQFSKIKFTYKTLLNARKENDVIKNLFDTNIAQQSITRLSVKTLKDFEHLLNIVHRLKLKLNHTVFDHNLFGHYYIPNKQVLIHLKAFNKEHIFVTNFTIPSMRGIEIISQHPISNNLNTMTLKIASNTLNPSDIESDLEWKVSASLNPKPFTIGECFNNGLNISDILEHGDKKNTQDKKYTQDKKRDKKSNDFKSLFVTKSKHSKPYESIDDSVDDSENAEDSFDDSCSENINYINSNTSII
jgi:hypothetical protein